MLINLRNALMTGQRLPYNAEVEYLESTGTQWIDTGVLLQFPISADMTLAMVSPYGTLDALPVFGFRYGSASASSKFAIWFSKSRLKFALNYGSYDSSWRGSSVQSGQVVHLRTDGAKLYIDGSRVADGGTVTTSDASNTLTLFKMRDTSSVADRDQCVRYYSCKLYDANGVLVRDYIPVRKGAVGYLYDRVSGKLFGNAGTGDFVLGPDVVPVEWLSSDGAQYIDTEVVPDNTTGATAKFLIENLSYLNYVLGSRGATSGRFYLYNNEASSKVKYGWGTSITTNTDALLNQPIKASLNYLNDRKYIYNNEQIGTLSDVDFSGNTYSIRMFNANFAGGVSTGPLVGKIFDCAISKGDALVRSFRPVRIGSGSTWEGAMMDVLTRRIYRNAGTGAFTYGNDLKYPIPAT